MTYTCTPFIAIGNKKDKADDPLIKQFNMLPNTLLLSATTNESIDELKGTILHKIHLDELKKGDVIVTNIRHYENLLRAKTALMDVQGSIDSGITNDFLAMELKHACPAVPYSRALSALSEITGEEIPPTLSASADKYNGRPFREYFQ